MAIKHIARQYDYIGLSTDDKAIISTEGAVVYYTDTKKREIYHDGNWTEYIENMSADLEASDIQIGAIEIKDDDSDARVEVFTDKTMSVKNTNKSLPLIFHDESIVPSSGLEFEVGEYKNLRVGISGTATSHTILFRGESGEVVTPLTGIKEDGLILATSTNALNEVWEFDISDYDKVWFGLSAVVGGNITVSGKAGN